jgi:uncharacterized protein YbjT (DUF2867 family)
MSHTVAVTGATGHVGGGLARGLRERGVDVRAIGRHEDRLRAVAPGVDARVAALDDVGALTRALEGASAAFLLIPPSYGETDFRAYQRRLGDAIVRAVEASGVPRVVTLSSIGAEAESGTGPIAGLHELEKRLDAIPGRHVLHLRPAYFMENELNTIGLIRSAGIGGSALEPDRPFSLVATRDIAAAAVEILAEAKFTGRTFRELLGPREYTPREVTRLLGESVGRPDLPHVQFGYEDTKKAIVQAGISPDVARLFVEMYQAMNEGRVRSLEGRGPQNTTPTTFEAFAKDVFAPAYNG